LTIKLNEITKNKWVHVDFNIHSKRLLKLIKNAYKNTKLGSFYRSKKDLIGNRYLCIDIGKNPGINATIFYRKARPYENFTNHKIRGIGHDGNAESVSILVSKLNELLKNGNFWLEASGAAERVLYKIDAPYVSDEALAMKLFSGKNLKFTGNMGQYTRLLDNGVVTRETIFGYPKLKGGMKTINEKILRSKLVRESLDEESYYIEYEEHDPEINRHGDKYWYNEDRQRHREDGPAIEYANGAKDWWQNDKRHREDGPARIWADGSKEWWVNGKRHREDGPAIIWADGSKEWYINHKRHREDGPAIIWASGTKAWYINGQLHREDGPARIWASGNKEWWLNSTRQPDYFGKKPIRENLDEEPYYIEYEEHDPEIDRYGNKRWYTDDGKLHREDGPAVEWADGGKDWYINGQLHREDGPAEIWEDGSKFWYQNDKRHREDGPARIWSDGSKEWWINNQRHREDGPAMEDADGYKAWWLNGARHREDGPAVEWADGSKEWWLNDEYQPDYFGKKPVRESLVEEPYVDYEEPEVDKYGTTWWYNEDGELHREDGPAVEYVDGTKHWYINGKHHREDGPAIVRADGSKFWFLNNKSHREDGPADVWSNGTKEWRLNNKLHREDGPAIEHADGSKFWYLNGEQQPAYFGKKQK